VTKRTRSRGALSGFHGWSRCGFGVNGRRVQVHLLVGAPFYGSAPDTDRTDGVNQTKSAERTVVTAIGIGRIVWGATTALAPARVHRTLGVDYPGPDRGIWIKAFGVRDIVLGAAALHPDQTVRRLVLQAGIAMDLVDAGVVITAARNGVPRRAAGIGVLLAGGTAVIAAVGPSLLRRAGRGKS
jgi:hypothetical protein